MNLKINYDKLVIVCKTLLLVSSIEYNVQATYAIIDILTRIKSAYILEFCVTSLSLHVVSTVYLVAPVLMYIVDYHVENSNVVLFILYNINATVVGVWAGVLYYKDRPYPDAVRRLIVEEYIVYMSQICTVVICYTTLKLSKFLLEKWRKRHVIYPDEDIYVQLS